MVNSTGRAGIYLSEGCGHVENSTIAVDIASANLGFVAQKSGRVDVPFHDVRICVLVDSQSSREKHQSCF